MKKTLPFHTANRSIDAPLLSFCLPELIEKIKQEDSWKIGDRNAITLVKNSSMRIVLIALHEQSEIDFHQSGNMISVQVIEGVINFQTEQRSVLLNKGGLLTLHENIQHKLTSIEEAVFLLTIVLCPENII